MQFKEVLAVHGPLVCAYPIVCYYLINFDVVAYEVFFVQGISCHEISFSQVSPHLPSPLFFLQQYFSVQWMPVLCCGDSWQGFTIISAMALLFNLRTG